MFVSLKSGREGAGIYAVSPGASLRKVASNTVSPVKISPDGRQLLFIRSTSESQTFVVSCRDGSNAGEVLTGEGVADWASPNSIMYIDRSGLVTTIDLPSGRKRKVVRDGRLGSASELRAAGGVAVVGVRSSVFLVDFSNPSGSVDVKRDDRFYMGVAAPNRDIYALRETIKRQGPYVVADADLWTLKGGSHEWRTVRSSVGAPIDMEVTSDGRCLILVYRLYSESSHTGVFLFDLNSLKSKRILSGNKFTSAVAFGGCKALTRVDS